MSLDLSIIDNEIRSGILNKKYNKYNLPLVIKSITQKDSGEIEIVLEYPPREITTIVLSSSSKEIEISDFYSDPIKKSQLDLGRIYNVIQNIIDDLNYYPSKGFLDKKRESFIGKIKRK